jgi:hypothetical protein
MEKQEQKQIVGLDEFDTTVSLWQLLPAGAGRGLHRLKTIVNSIHNGQVKQSLKPLSLLIAGKQGLRTHARCVLRAWGLEHPGELPAHLLQSTADEIFNFFSPSQMADSHIISSVSLLYPAILKTLYEVVSTGEFSKYDNIRKTTEVVPVFTPIVMTTNAKDNVPTYFQQKIDHIVELEDYSEQQLQLIVLQRLKYCGLDYDEEKVLQLIVEYGLEKLHNIIRLLKSSITVMLADSRTTLTVEDVKNVMSYS